MARRRRGAETGYAALVDAPSLEEGTSTSSTDAHDGRTKTLHPNAPLVLVTNLTSCGESSECNSFCSITPMLKNIRPAVEHFIDYAGDKTSENKEFVQMVTDQNVRFTIAGIREKSPILSEMESKGEIKIVGGIYSMDSGTVTFIEE